MKEKRKTRSYHSADRTEAVNLSARGTYVIINDALHYVFTKPKGAELWNGGEMPKILSCTPKYH